MANKKISELPLIQRVSGSVGYLAGDLKSVIPIVVAGTTTQMIVEDFSKFVTAYNATTQSNTFLGNQTITGNISVSGTSVLSGNTTIGGTLVVAGRLTAEEFHTEITTASVIYSSGSTKFGDDTLDRHEFTGSIYAKDSIIIGTEVLGNAGLNAFSASFSAQLARVQQATASLQQATSSLQAHSASVDAQLLAIQQTTQSLQVATASLQAFSSSVNSQLERVYQTTQSLHVATASLQAHSASVDSQLLRLQQTTQSLQVATASLQAFSSSVNDQLQRVYQTTQSLHVATASSQFHSASVDAQLLAIQQTTQSLHVATASLQAFSSSVNDQSQRVYQTTQSLHVATASLQAFTASQDGRNFVISQYTSSTDAHIVGISAYTASNETWKTGVRAEINGIEAWTASLDTLYATDAQLYQLYQATRSLELLSGSMIGITNGLMAYTASNETWKTGVRGEVNGIEAYTSSLKAAISVSGTNVQIIGDLNVNKLNVQYVSSSVLVTSGSNIFGDQSTDKHEFTGSVNIKDTLFINGDAIGLNGLNSSTASLIGITNGLMALTASMKSQAIVSSSTQIQNYDVFALNSNLYNGTGSIKGEIAGIEAYTASLKSAAIVSSSQQIQNYFTFAQTSSASTTFYGNLGVGGTPTGTYGKLSVYGGIALQNDNNGKLEIGRYSAGTPNSYIKLGANSNALKITNNTDLADIFELTNIGDASFSGHVTASGNLRANQLYVGGATTSTGLVGASEAVVQNELGIQYGDATGTYMRLIANGANSNTAIQAGAFSGANPSLDLIAAGGSTAISIKNDAGVNFGGALTASIYKVNSGGGIDFSSNANASGMTSELLDDYETGTWTPQVYYQNSTDQSNSTNVTQVGTYTKIGNVVVLSGVLQWTVTGSPANDNIGIKNFPFTSKTGSDYVWWGNLWLGNAGSYPTDGYTLRMDNNTAYGLFYDTRTDTGNYGDEIGATGTKTARFTITYLSA